MDIFRMYHESVPQFITDTLSAHEMIRLKGIGMDCGCEYTSFSLFDSLTPYSRYDHSLGVALIVWHFTGDVQQTLAALFHDISSPVFAHVIDFLNGDHMTQESTEKGIPEIIASSKEIGSILRHLGLTCDDVSDYHRFPVADNDSPRLSADRLEYTCGNIIRYGFASLQEVQSWYEDLFVGINEEDAPELMFSTKESALRFAQASLKCSKVYVSDEDRFSMQTLAEILKGAIRDGVLSREDLDTTEYAVIQKLQRSERYRMEWERFRSYRQVLHSDTPDHGRSWIQVPSKKRFIDPFVSGVGRLSGISEEFHKEVFDFISESLDYWICGQPETSLDFM